MEGEGVTVVGTILEPAALEGPAHRAELRIERGLVGTVERGAVVPIAWEERARARPPRFADGDRVLVVLVPLSGHSIWRQRFPEHEERARVLGVAERGGAFLRSPRAGEVTLLEHYLALGRVGQLDAQLDPTSARRLAGALRRPDFSARQRGSLLELVAKRRLESLHEPLEVLAGSDELAPAPVFEALGRLDGTLTPAQTTRLLARSDSPAHRAVGARYASGPEVERRLARLIRRDAAPEVRAAALSRLVELRGVGAMDRVIYGLGDEDVRVRETAILSIGALGPEAVPALRDEVENGGPEAAQAAVGALAVAGGDSGRRALVEIAETHPDPGVRDLARAALGRPIGHSHD
jgi:hypothetical protein